MKTASAKQKGKNKILAKWLMSGLYEMVYPGPTEEEYLVLKEFILENSDDSEEDLRSLDFYYHLYDESINNH